MRVETTIQFPPDSIHHLASYARELEEIGYDSILIPEAGHDPFLPLMTLAEHTTRPRLGTGIAVAFPRSPFVTAQIAWDLQRFSGGRLLLGLGTQVKGHNERRYSVPWSAPGPRLREYILCLRAIFKTFQTGEPPAFLGRHYQFTLISPFFNPGPIEHPDIPIYISAVNPYNCRLAGEMCDGVRTHPLNTVSYLKEVIIPSIEEGARKAGRSLAEIDIVVNPFTVTGKDQEELEQSKTIIRRHISFYASTRTYRRVMEHHGWTEIGERLYRLSLEGRWNDMGDLITEEMLNELAIVATYDELAERIRERFAGLAGSVNLVFGPPYLELQERQRRMVRELRWLVPELQRM